MLFNSFEFLLFFIIFFFLYWRYFCDVKSQNILIFISSYLFYAFWDYRFLILILSSSIIDFFIGKKIYKSQDIFTKKIYLSFSLILNIGLLSIFKYLNFFISSFENLLNIFDVSVNYDLFYIILPVGISFYTFQTLSYSFDIYNGKLKPTNDFISFAAFVSFFPQLIAGPIERASNFLPQLSKPRRFNLHQVDTGFYLILWRFFKKIVIADSISPFVDNVFLNFSTYSSLSLIIAAICFSIQIYCDFSGYTDIARGLAKMLGFELMINFKNPYFSRNISEFWRRWHISLSTWFRDYLYIPLGGSRVSLVIALRNIFTIFLVSGFWHGANLTFLVWGGIHAFYFLPSFFNKSNRKYIHKVDFSLNNPSLILTIFNVLLTFLLVTLAWIFFRSENITLAIDYIFNFFKTDGLNYFSLQILGISRFSNLFLILFFTIFLFIKEYYYDFEDQKNFSLKSSFILILIIIFFGNFIDSNSFIYFQF